MAGLWDVLVGAATGGTEQLDKILEQKRKLQQLQFAAQSEAQAKQLYPDAQEQARRQILSLIGQVQPQPTLENQPQITVSPTATPDQRALMQSRWIAPIAQQAQAKNAEVMDKISTLGMVAHPVDPFTAIMMQQYLNQSGGQKGLQPTTPGGGSIPLTAPPTPEPGASINDYVQQLAQHRATPRMQSFPSFGISGGRASFSQKPIPPRSVPEGSLVKLNQIDDGILDLETMMIQEQKFADRLGPLNLELKRNPIANVALQYDKDNSLDPFLRGNQAAELRFRLPLEGVRFLQAGQNIAQATYPDPRKQRHAQFQQTAQNFLAHGLMARERALQNLYNSGYDVSSIPALTSELAGSLPVGQYIPTGNASQAGSPIPAISNKVGRFTIKRK